MIQKEGKRYASLKISIDMGEVVGTQREERKKEDIESFEVIHILQDCAGGAVASARVVESR